MNKILKINEIVLDEKLYPRNNILWQVIARYKNAIRSGDKFPPIVVALFNEKYILVDGAHRLEAYKQLKGFEHVGVEVLTNLTEEEIYVEAVKRNNTHGAQFSYQETNNIILRLQDLGYDNVKISELVKVPATEITNFLARSVVTTSVGNRFPLKPTLRHLVKNGEVESKVEQDQESYSAISQMSILDEVISLIENKYINLNDERIVKRMVILKDFMDKFKFNKVKVKKKKK